MAASGDLIRRRLKTSRLLGVFLCFSTTNFSRGVKLLIVFIMDHSLSGGGFRGLPQPIDLNVGFVSRKNPSQRLFTWSVIQYPLITLTSDVQLSIVSLNEQQINKYLKLFVTSSLLRLYRWLAELYRFLFFEHAYNSILHNSLNIASQKIKNKRDKKL
jgi:hypothetical protein